MADSSKFTIFSGNKSFFKSKADLQELYLTDIWQRSAIDSIDVILKMNDDNISEIFFFTDLDDYHQTYMSAFCDFLKGSSSLKANSNMREFESYLRDENHIEAFDLSKIDIISLDKFHDLIRSCVTADVSPIVCHCVGTTYRQVEDQLRFGKEFKTVIDQLNCGSVCGSCVQNGVGASREFYLKDIEINVQAKIENSFYESKEFLDGYLNGKSSIDLFKREEKVITEDIVFKSLSLSRKIELIDNVFAKKIRPFLQQDGGDLELLDVDDYDVFIQYTGACGSCASSIGGTLQFITQTLMDEFQDKKINVIVEQ